ncbi:hypothetical protein [Desulfarculus baarsii]
MAANRATADQAQAQYGKTVRLTVGQLFEALQDALADDELVVAAAKGILARNGLLAPRQR